MRKLLPLKDWSLILKIASPNSHEEIRHLLENILKGLNSSIRTRKGSSHSRSQMRREVWLAEPGGELALAATRVPWAPRLSFLWAVSDSEVEACWQAPR